MQRKHTQTLETVGYEQWSHFTSNLRAREVTVGKSFIVGNNCNELVRRADVESLIEGLLKPEYPDSTD